ncbi:MAG: hypothetical protein R3F34_16420 [Planctomycetota bacterium]
MNGPAKDEPAGRARGLRLLWSELVLPALVAFGCVAIAMALVEGPPIGDFLYAIF